MSILISILISLSLGWKLLNFYPYLYPYWNISLGYSSCDSDRTPNDDDSPGGNR